MNYNNIEGNVLALGGAVYYTKIKVYQVVNPKFANVFVIFPAIIFPDYKGLINDKHAVFIGSEDLDYYFGRNSWGEKHSHFKIPKLYDDEKKHMILKSVLKNC